MAHALPGGSPASVQGTPDSDICTAKSCLLQERSAMKKALPSAMFSDAEQARLTVLRNWILEQDVTEIEMTERQFWTFAQLQPLAEKPWSTFMGRQLRVPQMPEDAQKRLGILDTASPGSI
jgi:hypothetical protein